MPSNVRRKKRKKNPNTRAIAQILSARGASKGGKARAKSLTKEARSEIARQAVRERWRKVGKLKEDTRNSGIYNHMGVLYQMLATWVLALEWLGKDPDTLSLQYEPPTGGDILFTLHGDADLTFCECKLRSTEPRASDLRKWFIGLYRDHATEIAACQGEVTLTIVTSLRPRSKLYRAAANLRHRPGYLRGKLKLDDKAIPHPCNLQLVHLPSDLEVLSAKIGWGIVSRLGLPLSPRTVRQHLHEIEVRLVQERHASRKAKPRVYRLQSLLVEPLKKIAQEQIEVLDIEEGTQVNPKVERERLEKLLDLQRTSHGTTATDIIRAKLHKNARLIADIIDFCRRHPGNCKEALLSLVGGFRTEYPLFQELKKLVPSHVTWNEALDIAEAALHGRDEFVQQAALELLQQSDSSDSAIVERIIQIASDALAEHAGTDESNDHVLEGIGKLALKLLPNLSGQRKREIVEDIFTTCSQLLTDHSWYHFGTAPVLYKVARELTLESFENFQWFVELLKEAHLERGIHAIVPYRGYEVMGHGTSQVGSGFSTGDYNYAANILSPALLKFEKEHPKRWDAFWRQVCETTVDAKHPVWLKRAAIPVLISQAQREGSIGKKALAVLAGYVSILRGIPSPSEIIFEKLTNKKGPLNEEQRLCLVDADMHSPSVTGVVYPSPNSIYGFEVLFQLCISEDDALRRKAQDLVREFITSDRLNILQIERMRSFSQRLHLLLALPESRVLLQEVITAFLAHTDELLKIEDYDEPTTCFVDILEKLFLEQKDEAHKWVKELFLEERARAYGQRIVCGVMLHFVEKPETISLYEELHTAYGSFLEPDRLAYCEARQASAIRTQLPDQSLDSCIRLLETSLKHPELHTKEYSESDKSIMQKEYVHFICGTEGNALFTLNQVAHVDPKRAYTVALWYWLESPSPYLRRMACTPLRVAIAHLITGPRQTYLYDKACIHLEAFAGEKLSRLREKEYQLPGIWSGINEIIYLLRGNLTYEEVLTFLELGRGREEMHWVLFYYAHYHGTVSGYAGPQWKPEEREAIREQFKSYLISGEERGITQLLTEIRNIVRKDKCDKQHIAMMECVLRERPKNDVHIMNTLCYALSDAAEANDEQLLQFVEPFYDLWLIPIVNQISPDGPFVYIARSKDVMEWLHEKDPKCAKALARRLLALPEEWQYRIFQDLDLQKMAK